MSLTNKINKAQVLSQETIDEIEHWLKKFPKDKRESAIIPALQASQKQNQGYLTDNLITEVAHYLQVPRAAVFEVATFYSLFNLKPVGKHQIFVCTNIACMLCGCEKIVDYLKTKLNIELGETTEDKKFTLKSVECLAACGGAPMMQIDEVYYENLTPEKVDKILEAFDT